MKSTAQIWEEVVTLPTYPAAEPENCPLFLERRTYQGSSGKVYPLPVTEKVSDVCELRPYKAVFLENEYLKIMVLPELGGRIHRAYDKTNGYDFVYYNHVVKPALVGLTGPWISGGIEFNWPQHHRPTTFAPVDYALRQEDGGAVAVYVGETDQMYGTKGMAAIRLYPGRAYIEISGRLFNPTDLPQTFLWWANPAVPVNENTYSVFPPDVTAVMDHGRRAVSRFPIATGEYYKADYSAGVDISRYCNVPVPTSYMADHSDFDFIGNYDEGRGAGLLHVADHHIAPGKKQWTWGCGDFGRAWDRNLTDSDGPYIELMTGVYTDNQPDFTWLKPQEEKTFTQYFMPYKGVGRVLNATIDAAVGLTLSGGAGRVKVYATAPQPGARVQVRRGETRLLDTAADLGPKACWEADFPAGGSLQGCEVTVTAGSRVLVQARYAETPDNTPLPSPADPLPEPAGLRTTEECYLAGLHLEQYRHATFAPEDYYAEGLRRDPTDLRLNHAMGRLLCRRGQPARSLPYLEEAIRKQTWRNRNPYHGACFYDLALAREMLGEDGAAYDAFYKATWSAETQGPAFLWLARLSARQGALDRALAFTGEALVRNAHNMSARLLQAALCRHLGRDNAALLAETLALDPLDLGALYEDGLRRGDLTTWRRTMRQAGHNFRTLALSYMLAGLWQDACAVLAEAAPDPLTAYYAGWAQLNAGEKAAARALFAQAETLAGRCFPNRVREIPILQAAHATLGRAPHALAALGCLWYDKKQYAEAIAAWEESLREDPDQPLVCRNLAIARFNHCADPAQARALMRRARELDPDNPRLLLEADQLAARLGEDPAKRLADLGENLRLTAQRDDLYIRYIALLNLSGCHAQALDALLGRRFHPWEGGEGKVSAEYRAALLGLARTALAKGDLSSAEALLNRSKRYPENLGEGKLPNVPDNEADYLLGLTYTHAGREADARDAFRRATAGPTEPGRALYYNDQPSDFLFFQGLAHRALGEETEARRVFHRLCDYGAQHLADKVGFDFFAVSLPEIEVFDGDLSQRNRLYCLYLRALGLIGLQRGEEAASLLAEVLRIQPDEAGAARALADLQEAATAQRS